MIESSENSPKKEENNIINQKSDNEITLYEKSLISIYEKCTNNYLLCPFCFKSIPLIIPFINTRTFQLNIYLYCKCTKKQIISIETLLNINMPSIKAKNENQYCEICKSNKNFENILYCLFCNKWICESCRTISFKNEEKFHLYVNNELNFQDVCDYHEIYINDYFCIDCEKSICLYCKKKEHKEHNVIQMENYYKNTEEQLQKIYNANVENVGKFNEVKFFDFIYNNIMNIKKYKKDCEKTLKIKIDINDNISKLIEQNLKLNLQVFYFIKFIYEKFKFSKGFMNNNLIISMNSLLNFNFNGFDQLLKNNNNQNINANDFKYEFSNFLSNNYIIKINNLIDFKILQKESSFLQDENRINNFLRLHDYFYIFLSNNQLKYYDIKADSISNYIYNKNEVDKTHLLIPKQRSMSNSFKTMKNKEIKKEKNTLEINFLVKISDNKLALAIGKTISIYNIIELLLNPECSFKEHKKNINFLYAINNDERLISSTEEFEIKIWDIKNKQCIYNIEHEFFSVKESIKNKNLYYFGTKNGILEVDTTKTNTSQCVCHKDKVTCLTMKNNFLISGSKDKFIKKLIIEPTYSISNQKYCDSDIKSIAEINDKFFGVVVDEIGLVFIDYINFHKINYINLYKEKLLFFSALGDGYFFGNTNEIKYMIIKGNNLSEKTENVVLN